MLSLEYVLERKKTFAAASAATPTTNINKTYYFTILIFQSHSFNKCLLDFYNVQPLGAGGRERE